MSILSTRVSIPEQVFFRDLGGEAVLLELATGRYYGFDEVGTRMWLLLREHGEVKVALDALTREYQVPEGELRQDLLEFVDSLASRRLLDLHERKPESNNAPVESQ